MRRTYYYFILPASCIFFLSSNSGCEQQPHQGVKISTISDFPLYYLNLHQQVHNWDTSSYYYFHDIIVFKRGQNHGEFEANDSPDADTVEMELVSERKRYNYLVSKKGSIYGVRFDGSAQFVDYQRVDSFMQKNTVNISLKDMISNCSLLNRFEKKGEIEELYYSNKINPKSLCSDTMKLKFSTTQKKLPFSYSKYLDSLYNSKLTEANFVVAQYYDTALKEKIPRQEVLLKMISEQITTPERAFLERIIKQYWERIKKR